MVKFLAMRVEQGKLDYKDVPEKYKQEVHDILIEEYGWTEHDFD